MDVNNNIFNINDEVYCTRYNNVYKCYVVQTVDESASITDDPLLTLSGYFLCTVNEAIKNKYIKDIDNNILVSDIWFYRRRSDCFKTKEQLLLSILVYNV